MGPEVYSGAPLKSAMRDAKPSSKELVAKSSHDSIHTLCNGVDLCLGQGARHDGERYAQLAARLAGESRDQGARTFAFGGGAQHQNRARAILGQKLEPLVAALALAA